ncbi:MAG: hypothetical protein J6P16_04250 [Eubacterium sp.]|nr:hypothetical protein [Eubacterium sp.]
MGSGVIKAMKNNNIYLIGSLVIILPILFYALLSVPAADDATNCLTMKSYIDSGDGYFYGAVKQTVKLYENTSGYYFAAFINYFTTPFARWGIDGLRIVNLILNCIFFISLYALVRAVCKTLLKTSEHHWKLFFFVLFLVVNGYANTEIYTWYCVLIAYVFSVSIMLFGLALFIDCEKKTLPKLIISAVLALLVSGSSLNVAVVNIELFFVAALIKLYRTSGFRNIILYIPFAMALVGGFINLLAPGNYIRHDAVTTNYNVISAVAHTISIIYDRVLSLVSETVFIPVMIIIIICCRELKDDERLTRLGIHPFIMSVLCAAAVFLVDFPVVFGYADKYFPDRCVYVQDVAVYFFGIIWCMDLVLYYRKKGKTPGLWDAMTKGKPAVYLCLVLFSLAVYGHSAPDGWTTMYMYKNIINGDAVEYADSQKDLLREIKSSELSDVVLPYDEKVPVDKFIKGTGIGWDPDDWINRGYAQLFDKNSVVMETLE